jgi:[ribosomal protein S18]-alanine N-acetyltransferase
MRAPGTICRDSPKANIRGAIRSDVPAIAEILKESPEASAWSLESLIPSELSENTWIAEQEGRVIGFLIGRAVADEFEILNMAVAKSARRLGVATRLIDTALERSRANGSRSAFLEVRASNESAIALYTQRGFRSCGRRRRYYRSPVEDAILLICDTTVMR